MKKLLEGLRQFQTGYFSTHKDLFEELSHGQHPRILFITCSDSRIDPNLITQAQVGELFVIRNAGNIIPPYGAANGGEGAAMEYAIEGLNIEQIIVCGHSFCGAMKGLLKMNSLEDKMPLVYQWLKHAEATRKLVKENYSELEKGELLEATVAENVLNQLENLRTYPSVRSRIHQKRLSLHGWIYRIETGKVLAYDPSLHDFIPPSSQLPSTESEYNWNPTCSIPGQQPFHVPGSNLPATYEPKTTVDNSYLPGSSHLPVEQSQRIYRGSNN